MIKEEEIIKQDKIKSLCLQYFKTRSHRFLDTQIMRRSTFRTREDTVSAIIQDKITQVPWHTHKPVHITHTHTHTVSHVVWHTTQTHTLTHTNTLARTQDWIGCHVVKPFLKIWTHYTHTHYVSESQWWFVRRPSLFWCGHFSCERRSSTRTRTFAVCNKSIPQVPWHTSRKSWEGQHSGQEKTLPAINQDQVTRYWLFICT